MVIGTGMAMGMAIVIHREYTHTHEGRYQLLNSIHFSSREYLRECQKSNQLPREIEREQERWYSTAFLSPPLNLHNLKICLFLFLFLYIF